MTPKENKDYFFVTKDTRWMMPGAKQFITLAWIQDWTTKYNSAENAGLLAKDGDDKDVPIGMYILDRTGGGYERDTILTDGPIIYGTNMNDADRQKAWEQFFMMMLTAATTQQGLGVVNTKMLRRCAPSADVCTTTLDANLVGIGGIKEPRKVMVTVVTGRNDLHKQLNRTVCTWPASDTLICRNWDTGKLIGAEHKQADAPLSGGASQPSGG